jgi:hypothetical protein
MMMLNMSFDASLGFWDDFEMQTTPTLTLCHVQDIRNDIDAHTTH